MSKSILTKLLNLLSNRDKDFDYKLIENIIEYRFKDKSLLIKAFKHRSYLSITKEDPVNSNERLEFLGDAILDHAATIYLYNTHKEKPEGRLSQMKSVLVSSPVLAEACQKLNIGRFLLIDKGEEKTGGKARKSNLTNLYEALIGAIYLDAGYDIVEKFIGKTLLVKSQEILAKKKYLNFKSILLEYSQSKGMGNPTYKTINESGPDHHKIFIIKVSLNSEYFAEGGGSSKKAAEQKAARNLIIKISPQLIEN